MTNTESLEAEVRMLCTMNARLRADLAFVEHLRKMLPPGTPLADDTEMFVLQVMEHIGRQRLALQDRRVNDGD